MHHTPLPEAAMRYATIAAHAIELLKKTHPESAAVLGAAMDEVSDILDSVDVPMPEGQFDYNFELGCRLYSEMGGK